MPDFLDDFSYILTSPARIDERSLLILGAFSTVTTSLMIGLDTPIYNKSKEIRPSSYNLMATPGRFYDAVDPNLFAFGSSSLLIGAGYLLNDRKMARTGWTAAEAVIFTQMTTGLLKTVFGRERPFVEDGNLDFDPLEFDSGATNHSMPSGHISKIFALATVISSSYDSPWVRIPAYAMAGSVAVQRIESHKHWISDVVVGGALGYFMGRALAHKNGLVKSNSRLYPVVKGGLVGLNIQF